MKESLLIITKYTNAQDYEAIFNRMVSFTKNRTNEPDQIWVLEHNPVYTQGLAGKPDHILEALPYPLVQSDRGGQITFHGKGQLICYLMINLNRKGLTILDLVNNIEKAIIDTLAQYNIIANTNKDIGRGVFIGDEKIAFVGLKIKNKCSYHGLSLNINNDISNYQRINPCGIEGLKLTTVEEHFPSFNKRQITIKMLEYLCSYFGYDKNQTTTRTV